MLNYLPFDFWTVPKTISGSSQVQKLSNSVHSGPTRERLNAKVPFL